MTQLRRMSRFSAIASITVVLSACTSHRTIDRCQPISCESATAECGLLGDGCGGMLDCGRCGSNEICGAVAANQCRPTTCTPKSCKDLDVECGSIDDGCGNRLSCGECQAPQVCGGGGSPHRCGTGCVPKTCADLNAGCGELPDGCGHVLKCGSCNPPMVCGGGVALQCGVPACSDGIRDGSETDVDCGGVCPGCAIGQQCASQGDCDRGGCVMGTCANLSWEQVNLLDECRIGQAGAIGPDGQLYVFGGTYLYHSGLGATAASDPNGLTAWKTLAPAPTLRTNAVALTAPNGRIYLLGGRDHNDKVRDVVESYDPTTDTWSVESHLTQARERLAAALGNDGRIYVFGGLDSAGQALASAEVLNNGGSWEPISPVPSARIDPAAAASADGRIFVFGGDVPIGGSRDVEVYDLQTGGWTSDGATPSSNGYSGGAVGWPGGLFLLVSRLEVDVFDPNSDRWTPMPSLNYPSDGPVVSAADGTVYHLGSPGAGACAVERLTPPMPIP